MSAFQECFATGYSSFNMEQVQYVAAAGGSYPETNKYDPKYTVEASPAKVCQQVI